MRRFTLRTLIGWRYAYGDVRPSVSQSFAGAFGSFTVAGVPVDRNAFGSETNLDYAVELGCHGRPFLRRPIRQPLLRQCLQRPCRCELLKARRRVC